MQVFWYVIETLNALISIAFVMAWGFGFIEVRVSPEPPMGEL